MTSVLLIYPYFRPLIDRTVFRFPPLGLAYLGGVLQAKGYEVQILDCTFLSKKAALKFAMDYPAEVVGIYCMSTLLENCLYFARTLRERTRLLIAGGPLPTCDPQIFLPDFDLVVRGEGEETLIEILDAYVLGSDYKKIPGLIFRDPSQSGQVIETKTREWIKDLNKLPFPARELLQNRAYIRHGKRKNGFSITTIASTRGCPFSCEFCSNVVFGGTYRDRSPEDLVDEIEEVLLLGYDRISFTDDVFTLDKLRVKQICALIKKRGLNFLWECLGRVDSMDEDLAIEMKSAGCFRIFFGIESGSPQILEQMNKRISLDQARSAIETASKAGIETGAFFIIFYPGDTEESILETLDFAASLPLDYLGLTPPYLLPGTSLLNRILVENEHFAEFAQSKYISGKIPYIKGFSKTKMRIGILKGRADHEISKRLGTKAPSLVRIFRSSTRYIFRLLK